MHLQLFHHAFYAVFILCLGIAMFHYPRVRVKKSGNSGQLIGIAGLILAIGSVPMFFVVIDDIYKLLK